LIRNVYNLIKNDNIDVNDPDERNISLRSILDFLHMVTRLSLTHDPEVARFFIEETSQMGKFRGTQTYLPLTVLLEFLKKEKVSQGNFYK
jgi:hypothetical protein